MKKIILSMAFASGLSLVNAQETKEKKESKLTEAEVPAAVKTKFASLYAGVKAEKWEQEHGNFEVKFHQNKTEMSILLDPSGSLLETETEIEVKALPQSVTDYVAKNKPGRKIREASKIVDIKGVLTYEAEVDKTDLVFDSKGIFLKESKD